MRIAYLMAWSGRPDSGVMKKVAGQVRVWRDRGHEVRIFVVTAARSPMASPARRGAPPEIEAALHIEMYRHAVLQPRAVGRLTSRAETWGPDILYGRYGPWYPALTRAARRLPTVLEVNTDDRVEFWRSGSRARAVYNALTRRRLLRACAGLVFVTSALRSNRAFRWFEGATSVIPNGIDLDEVPILPPARGETPCLAFVGSPGHAWHGLDRLLDLAVSAPDWEFEVIGYDASPSRGAGPPNVRFNGFLTRQDYEPILARAHAAVGSLALDRNRMTEASSLKIREYLAYGLPVILGCPDADFPDGAPFLLEVDSQNFGAHIDEVAAFVQSWRDRRVPRKDIVHLDGAVKERQRLEFLAEVL